jgi:hypothetical protein
MALSLIVFVQELLSPCIIMAEWSDSVVYITVFAWPLHRITTWQPLALSFTWGEVMRAASVSVSLLNILLII